MGGQRRRSTSGGSLSESPVAPYLWQISPTQQSPPTSSSTQMLQQGNARQATSARSSPHNTKLIGRIHSRAGELSRHLGSDALADHAFHCATDVWNMPYLFSAPDLPIETLLDRSHNETLAKLNFVVALCDCILEVADAKCAPLSAIMSADPPMAPHAPEHCKRSERLVLLVRLVTTFHLPSSEWTPDLANIINYFVRLFCPSRSLQLLSSGLNLAMKQISDGHLKPSDNVKNGKLMLRLLPRVYAASPFAFFHDSMTFCAFPVITTMNSKYKMILLESKKLNGTGLLQKANANNITADKILYEYAIQMVSWN